MRAREQAGQRIRQSLTKRGRRFRKGKTPIPSRVRPQPKKEKNDRRQNPCGTGHPNQDIKGQRLEPGKNPIKLGGGPTGKRKDICIGQAG